MSIRHLLHLLATPVALGALVLVAACGDTTGPPVGDPGLHVVSTDSRTDTIGSRLPEPLRLRVLGPDGRPRREVPVRIEAVIASAGYEPQPWAWVGAAEGTGFAMQLDARTDREGFVGVRLMLGLVAGEGAIRVLVPSQDLEELIPVTVLPGAGVDVRAFPADTVALVGSGFPLRGAVVDRRGNARSDPVSHAAISGDIAVEEGVLKGIDVSRGAWTVRHGQWVDTGRVTIVPPGEYAAFRATDSGETASVVVMTFDGIERHRFPVERWAQPLPDWAPDGRSIVVEAAGAWSQNDEHVLILGLDGSRTRPLVARDRVTRQRTPRFSPDGGWIFFTGIPLHVDDGALPNHHGRQEIWRMKVDGTQLARIGPSATYYKGDWSPAVASDGRHLAFVTDRAEIGEPSIRTLDLATGEVDTYVDGRGGPIAGSSPIWSPVDPELFVFGVEHRGSLNTNARRIWRMRVDGTDRSTVGEGIYRPTFAWSPDGRWLLAQSFAHDRLELVEVETGRTLPLPFTNGLSQPSWRP